PWSGPLPAAVRLLCRPPGFAASDTDIRLDRPLHGLYGLTNAGAKPPQATYEPPTSHLLGKRLRPTSHPHATPMRPSSHHQAKAESRKVGQSRLTTGAGQERARVMRECSNGQGRHRMPKPISIF